MSQEDKIKTNTDIYIWINAFESFNYAEITVINNWKMLGIGNNILLFLRNNVKIQNNWFMTGLVNAEILRWQCFPYMYHHKQRAILYPVSDNIINFLPEPNYYLKLSNWYITRHNLVNKQTWWKVQTYKLKLSTD